MGQMRGNKGIFGADLVSVLVYLQIEVVRMIGVSGSGDGGYEPLVTH